MDVGSTMTPVRYILQSHWIDLSHSDSTQQRPLPKSSQGTLLSPNWLVHLGVPMLKLSSPLQSLCVTLLLSIVFLHGAILPMSSWSIGN